MEIIKINGEDFASNLRSNSYLLVNDDECCVIDPSFDRRVVLQKLVEFFGEPKKIVSVILTHCHADHCAKLVDYVDTTVYLSPQAKRNLANPAITLANEILGENEDFCKSLNRCVQVLDNEVIEPISGVKLSIRYTSGHTDDSICIYNQKDIFVGDLLFANGGVGRTDFPTGNGVELRRSIRWVTSLPANIVVHSGHGEDFVLSDWNFFNK